MSYFNHAFTKTLVASSAAGPISALNNVQLGTSAANTLAAGQITFINPENWRAYSTTAAMAAGATTCCEMIIAAGSLMTNDKIGQFHGGYLESNKTKTIKARYANKLWAVPANPAQNYILHAGVTPWTIVPGNAPDPAQPGETGSAATCPKQFLCGETYYLRVDVKGSPALRLLDHNSYLTLEAYTGCCADDAIAPTPVDPRRVYIQWAQQIRRSKLMNQFVFPVVTFTNNNGTNWTYYYPDDVNVATLTPIAGVTFANYSAWVEQPWVNTMRAGLVLNGAYVETKFGNCTFQVSDFYELEPLRIYASEVDLTGSPCEFEGLCIGVQCYGRQANGVGETVVRDVILSERYRQNFLHSDFRIREITQGYDLYQNGGLSRTAFYDRIYIQHSVPRFYNPTGTFDNDQYIVEIVLPANPALNGTLGAAATAVLAQLTGWLTACESQCIVDEDPFLGAVCAASVPNVQIPAVPYPAGL